MKRVLVLGGGFGGVAAAHRLRELLDDADEVILADRGTHFMMGFRKTAEIMGGAMDEGSRPLKALESFGIQVRQGEVEAIDTAECAAVVGGERIEADAMLVALGAETVPEAVPGLTEHGIDVYTKDGARAAASALAGLDKGNLVIGIFGAPYTCPPAPFEMALLALEHAQQRGARIGIEVFSPLPRSLPILGKGACDAFEGRMAGLMIGFTPDTKATSVEAGAVLTESGTIPFDVLFAIPPHRVPTVISEADLAPGGWIKVEPKTLATPAGGVWAVGDCVGIQLADGKGLPKSGELAADAGLVAAEHMAAFVNGGTSDAVYWADGACYLETGGGEAMLVRGRFLADDAPQVELTPPAAEFYVLKGDGERARLAQWFGS